MNNIKIKLLSIIIIFNTACTQSKQRGNLVFDTNLENSNWSTSGSQSKFNNAHSGNFVCKINKDNAFTNNFEARVIDVSSKTLKTARISAWMMLTSKNSEQNLVLEIRDSSNQKTLEWLNTNAADYIDNLNQWVKIDLVVDLTINNRNNQQNIYRIYASNGKDDIVYVDDFEVGFE